MQGPLEEKQEPSFTDLRDEEGWREIPLISINFGTLSFIQTGHRGCLWWVGVSVCTCVCLCLCSTTKHNNVITSFFWFL